MNWGLFGAWLVSVLPHSAPMRWQDLGVLQAMQTPPQVLQCQWPRLGQPRPESYVFLNSSMGKRVKPGEECLKRYAVPICISLYFPIYAISSFVRVSPGYLRAARDWECNEHPYNQDALFS